MLLTPGLFGWIDTFTIPAKAKRLGRWIGTTGRTKKAYVELAGVPATE